MSDIWTVIAGVGAITLILFSIAQFAQDRPKFRLVAYALDEQPATRGLGAEFTVVLLFDNQGGSTATGVYAYTKLAAGRVRVPANGSVAVPVGGLIRVPVRAVAIDRPAAFEPKDLIAGDDWYFDLRSADVTIHWNRRIPSSPIGNKRFKRIHRFQQSVPFVFVDEYARRGFVH